MIISIPTRKNQDVFVNTVAIDYVNSSIDGAWIIHFRGGTMLPVTDPLMTIAEFVKRWQEALRGPNT